MLNANIENAHKLRKESSKMDVDKQLKAFQKPLPHISFPNDSDYLIDESPLLEGDIPDDLSGAELRELKIRHERLVDLILKEEDDLIATHHRFIENTINSVKEQERIRHEVNLPGSDVEEYIINLDGLLTVKQAEITQMKDQISSFHNHIKQEQDLSLRFYSMQEDQADIAPDLDDY
jgi:hypothetical protein